MAIGELRDLRAKVTPETWCALEAEHRATGRDHSEIVREVMHDWAYQKIRAANVLDRLLTAEGITGKGRERGGRGT